MVEKDGQFFEAVSSLSGKIKLHIRDSYKFFNQKLEKFEALVSASKLFDYVAPKQCWDLSLNTQEIVV